MTQQPTHSRLLKATELSSSDTALLRQDLIVKKIDELRKIMSCLSVCLTGSTRKKEIMDRIAGMAQIGAVHNPSEEDDAEDVTAIS